MDTTSIKVNKYSDPIWRSIWLGRIVSSIWLGLVIVYLGFFLFERAWEHQGYYFLLISTVNLFGAYRIASNAFQRERYWRRIARQRSLACHTSTSFRSREQPSLSATTLQLPVTARLSLRPGFIVSILVALFILLSIFAAFIIKSLEIGRSFDWSILLIGIGIFLSICILLFGFLYFIVFCAQTQSIELTEEGITTNYRQHKRSMRWEDARIFAQYPQDAVPKPVNGLAFELSNKQTVVRWSQQYIAFPYIEVQNNQQQRNDFNWLVDRVNAYIIERTGLPLLDFKDVQVGTGDR